MPAPTVAAKPVNAASTEATVAGPLRNAAAIAVWNVAAAAATVVEGGTTPDA
jgi:hypothetical protein